MFPLLINLTLPLTAFWNLVILRGGGLRGPPYDIMAAVISDPMLLYSFCLLVYLGVTCKNSDRNLNI